ILGNYEDKVKIWSTFKDQAQVVLLSEVKPKNVEEAIFDNEWIKVMQEKLVQFQKNDVWNLVTPSKDKFIIGTNGEFLNPFLSYLYFLISSPLFLSILFGKLLHQSYIKNSKVRFVAQGYSQQEGIDFIETFAPMARLEVIHILISFVAHCKMRLHQMDTQASTSCLYVKDGIYIHQTKYVKELLKEFNLEDCKTVSTRVHPTFILSLDETNKNVDQTSYRGMIGFLLYLTSSRSDIMFNICLYARFQANPRKSHLTTIKRIFIYPKSTTNLGFC
ncbi:putative mitochondrial protein, partial [Mucuna pruriens]